MKHIISRSLAWLVAGLGITTSVMAQNLPSFQTGPGNTFSQQTNGWPPTASNFDPLVPTENQFSSGTAFGGWLTHRITDGPNGTGNVLAGSETLTEGPTTIKVPSFSATVPTESLQMDSVKMGRPLVARQATVFFGSTISPPLVDASGQALPEGSFLAEPVNSSTSIYFAQSGLQEGRFYYSPHARAVFATQTGVVNVVWKYKDNTRVPSTQAIQYVVSSTPSTPAQRIYWTEKGFTGPVVTIPAGVVSEVSIRYNSEFQGLVSTEYQSPFALPADPAVSLPPEKRTFWYSKDDRSFRAYNAEGRVFVEFLGALRQDGVSRNFLGSEVVEVIRETKPKAVVTMIGDKLKPADGDTSLEARIVNGLVAFPAFLHQENSPTEKKYNYYAIRTTSPGETPDTPTGEVLLYWMKKGALGLQWPKYLDSHIVRWPEVSDANYATYIRADGAEGGAADTAAVFDTANNSALVFEDDNQGSVNEAIKFHTTLSAGNPDNLTLIRHGSGDNIWFERVHSVLNTAPEVSSSVIEVAVGDRIEPPTGLGLEPVVGYIHQKSGTGYDPTAYLNPFVEGVIAAKRGAIIAVNALENHETLEVWWFKKSANIPGNSNVKPTYWPSVVRKYRIVWPDDAPQIVLASNSGSGELPSDQANGIIYYQNDRKLPGFNPNEEHALMVAGRAYALRDDLSTGTTSEPYVLVRYQSNADNRPAIQPFKVVREDATYKFAYTVTAGTILQAPMPLPILPVPLKDGKSANLESLDDTSDAAEDVGAPLHYDRFTYEDRKGSYWIYRGPHDGATVPDENKFFRMKYYYNMMAGFFVPNPDATVAVGPTAVQETQPAVGTILPYLRAYVNGTDDTAGFVGDALDADPIRVKFHPVWPASAPQLRLAETLTMPKFGLPAVRGNTSLDILYQQSLAEDVETPSAILFDPTRAKKFMLDGKTTDAKLAELPSSVNSSDYRGKTYFPNLPPHLSERFFLDPDDGDHGALVLIGKFMDETLGEDYLQLNVLSDDDVKALKGLCTNTGAEKTKWDAAIDGLSTTLETFEEDPQVPGTYHVSNDSVADAAWDWLKTFDFVKKVSKSYKVSSKVWVTTRISPRRGYYRYTTGTRTSIEYVYAKPTKAAFFAALQTGAVNAPRLAAAWQWASENTAKLQQWKKLVVDSATTEAAKKATSLQDDLREACSSEIEVEEQDLAAVTDSDIAVDSYALSASGGGTGYVVMVAGNGRAFTPEEEPVSMLVLKVTNPLYIGQVKPIEAANPLAEKLTMQHTGDFAGEPADYDFEWRYAPPVNGKAPALYSFSRSLVLGDGTWRHTPYGGAATDIPLPGPIVINDGSGVQGEPHSEVVREFTVSTLPYRLYLSLTVGGNDGVKAYINDALVASYNYPGQANSGTTTAPLNTFNSLPLLFEVPVSALAEGDNKLRLELVTSAAAGGESPASLINARLESINESADISRWLAVGKAVDETAGITNGSIKGKNRHVIEGASIFTLTDNYFIMRYRARSSDHAAYVANAGWSKWTDPALAEGWIKRALKGINPFEQRVKDLYNNDVNTDVSLLTQAGKRWEGDIPLNLENINEFGLIEIYETILRRGKMLSIDGAPPINYGPANDALLLAAGYLSDLYMLLGNEAYADASNPTIAYSVDNQFGDVSTSLFAFKGQLSSVLDEELSLLRGRDDRLAPGVKVTPIYNRLVWNYTRGIDSGEAVYALNYNMKDLNGDGVVNAIDAAKAYPQGHGDAYGHYLTAITGYYGLLANDYFDWIPRIEAVNVLGTPVNVDYFDERKFATAAAALARTSAQIVDLTYKSSYQASAVGWDHLKDGLVNAETSQRRSWGVDEWASRGGQGAYFHWLTANSTLPAVDTDPTHEGIEKVDRTTVPELSEIVVQSEKIQKSLSLADARLNPLGISDGALPFDISPTQVDAGKTHFEQIYDRSVEALRNAVTAFNSAKSSTQILRRQEDSLTDLRSSISEREQTFTKQLIDLYGTPYAGDMGPGKTYVQGYTGPDYFHNMWIDTPELFKNTEDEEEETETFTLRKGTDFSDVKLGDKKWFSDNGEEYPTSGLGDTVDYELDSLGNFRKPEDIVGARSHPGRIQQALSERMMARLRLHNALEDYAEFGVQLKRLVKQYEAVRSAQQRTIDRQYNQAATDRALSLAGSVIDTVIDVVGEAKDKVEVTQEITLEGIPKVVGLATDATAPVRGSIKTVTEGVEGLAEGTIKKLKILKFAMEQANAFVATINEIELAEIAWDVEHKQLKLDLLAAFEEFEDGTRSIDQALRANDDATRNYRRLVAEGVLLQEEREVFRKKASAILQGYKTKDLGFRVFRNEALESYKSLFDLAARYSFLAARAYDYETGLANAAGNSRAADFFQKIVKSRAVGVFSDNRPQPAGSAAGDPGLSGVLAQMNSDWSVVKSRLGFNNPDRYRTTFSLRQEKERIVPSATGDVAWNDALAASKMDNILDDEDVRRYCMQINGDGALAVPGFVISFQTTISDGYNFFGQPLAGGDSTFTPTSFATKIRSTGIAFKGYVGMASPTSIGGAVSGSGGSSPADPDLGFLDPNALSATPYVYLIAAGADSMRSPALGDSSIVRTWQVEDQAIALPFDIGGQQLNSSSFTAEQSLSEAFTIRKHQAFRAVPDGTVFSSAPGFTNTRLIGRSVWNSRWKLVIPGKTLLADPVKGMQIFQQTVKDIKLHLETYSYSGN